MKRRSLCAQQAAAPARKTDAGFTLIELMVVVSIIGVLAAVAIPRYMAYARSSQTAEVGVVAGSLVSAMTAYADGQGLAPTAAQAAFDQQTVNQDTPSATKNLLVLIPQLTLPSASKFNYVVSAAVATAGVQNGDVVFCIMATGRANAGVLASGVVLYSTSVPATSVAGWDGRINKATYLSGATGLGTIVAGGYCKADGTASPTQS